MNSRSYLLPAILAALILISGCTTPSPDAGAGTGTVKATFSVAFPDGTGATRIAEVEKGTNALDAMKTVFDVETQSFSAGEFVSAIEGIEAGQNGYWKLAVNGEYATTGIGGYLLNEDMNFGWEIEEIR